MAKLKNQNWIVSDGSQANRKQAIALAQACKIHYLEKIITPQKSIIQKIITKIPLTIMPNWLLKFYAINISPPYPKIIIACGRLGALTALTIKQLAIKQNSNCSIIQILNPKGKYNQFKLIIIPQHDNAKLKNSLVISGSLNDINPAMLKQHKQASPKQYAQLKSPIIGVLIGGDNKAYKLDNKAMQNIIKTLKAWSKQGYSIIGTCSRRTNPTLKKLLKTLTQQNKNIQFWNEKGENPYYPILANANAIAITEDSINMISEAFHTQKPTYILPLTPRNSKPHKFQKFHALHTQQKRIRPAQNILDFSWRPAPCNDMQNAITQVKKIIKKM